ncbi:hypothetical protein FRB95_013152 [Tulasnella sp. JGI-2019a]|nr:hypothetical protein FRB95_013152 [Tulasnella sp. JGI-2019a]
MTRLRKRISYFLVTLTVLAIFWNIRIKITEQPNSHSGSSSSEHSGAQIDVGRNSRPETVPYIASSQSLSEETTQSLAEAALGSSWRTTKLDHPSNEARLAEFNRRGEAALESCRTGRACARNQDKLIVLAYGHFAQTLFGVLQGENIWCDSVMNVIHALGYSMIMSTGDNNDLELIWRKHYSNILLVLWDNEAASGGRCLTNPRWMYSEPKLPIPPPNHTHLNIPIWKVFNFHWWNAPDHPLGGPFTLSQDDYSTWPSPHTPGRDNYYLGYSLDGRCLKTPYVPFVDRPRQAYVLTKRLSNFLRKEYLLQTEKHTSNLQSMTSPDAFFDTVSSHGNLTFVASFNEDVNLSENPGLPPLGITQLPHPLSQTAFTDALSHSRAVLGISWPDSSPSPWEALCLGVPFINPIRSWDPNRPEDRTAWITQHDGLLWNRQNATSLLDEPHVYHVKIGDRSAVERALRKAMDAPINRYIPAQMRIEALIERIRHLLETDWRPKGLEQLSKIAQGQKP